MSKVVNNSVHDSKRAGVDPDGASMEEENLRASPSTLSMKSSGSPRNYCIATDDGDEAVMTQTEVSDLVNKALRRARKSTSPRKSPKSSSFDDSSTTETPLDPVARSPQREGDYVSVPEATLSPSGDDFHNLLAPSNDSISLAPKASQDESVTAGSTSSNTHMSASDAIIRRVEEEIANARKAAEAASLRLTSALFSGETSSLSDWRSSNDPRDWEKQDAAVITMRPSMDINDILNDHLADDEEFRVDLDSSYAEYENSAYYGDEDARDEEFAAISAASSVLKQQQQQQQDDAEVNEEEPKEHGREKSKGLEQTEDDFPDDERRFLDGHAPQVAERELKVDETHSNVAPVVGSESDVQQSNGGGSNERAIEATATGDVSLQNSTSVPISETTGETTDDQVFQKTSTTSGDATLSAEDFGAESYETAEEDLPFPMDIEKGTPKTDEETSPTLESRDLPESEMQRVGVDKVPSDGNQNIDNDNKSHPAIGSEIFLSSQNMDAAVSQVDNDDASEYTEETISDEASDYTEVTIPDAEVVASSEKLSGQIADNVQAKDKELDRDDDVVPTEEELNVQIPPPVEKSVEQVSAVEQPREPILCDANATPEIIAETSPNDVVDKLENARKELEQPVKPVAPAPIVAAEPQRALPKAGPRRVTLSIITDPEGKSKREETAKSNEGLEETPKQAKEDKPKRARVTFRSPYPPPPPFPRKRNAEEIIEEYREPIPEGSSIWLRPKAELKQLLLAVTGASLPRRSNACGALKVLSMKMKKNKLTLVKTDGFLSALVFAIRENIPIKDRDVALDARSRAVSTVLNVVEPKENRTIVFGFPGLPEALVKVIKEDRAEARVHACQALVMLAKTPACREQIPKVDGLIDVLAKVVQKTIDINAVGQVEEEKKEDSFDDEDGNHGSSSFSDDDGSTDRSDDEESNTEGESSDESSVPENGAAATRLQSIRKKKNDQLTEFFNQARISACAALSHLSKHCSISSQLCANPCYMECLIAVSSEFDNPIHSKCIEMITNLTRFPSNNEVMAHQPALLEALVKCGKSKILADRVWALRAFQNMSSDSSSKVTLASSTILTLLSVSAVRKDYDERVPAVAALYNISTEPGAVVPLTNTRNVVATLVHLAHNSESTPEIRHMACDALATIGLWLQTLAGTGSYPEGVKKVPLPSHATTGWQIWN